jgi:hypothetical protein
VPDGLSWRVAPYLGDRWICFAQHEELIPYQEKRSRGSGFARQLGLAGGSLPWSERISALSLYSYLSR